MCLFWQFLFYSIRLMSLFLFHFFLFWPPCSLWCSRTGIISEPQMQPKLQRWQCWILNPLCWARDGTCILALPRCHQSHCAIVGTPLSVFMLYFIILITIVLKVISENPTFKKMFCFLESLDILHEFQD